MRGALLVCGTASDAGKSFVATGLCRLLARRGVRVAPFKAQNMALNSAVTDSGHEIGHAQWVQAVAAGTPPEVAMNPVLLKPTGERRSQVVVMGRPVGVLAARDYQARKAGLLPVVLDALDDLRRRFDVVVCEGAGSPAEINLLDGDITNLGLANAAGIPAVVVGDIDRGGVFASLYGTWALLPDHLRGHIEGFIVNKLRGDPSLLGDACDDLARRTGVGTLGVLPMVAGADLDAEDSLALARWRTAPAQEAGRDGLDVAVCALPRISNFGDLDPLRLEPAVGVRWVRSATELGRPDLVVVPGSKNTRSDLVWLHATGLAGAVADAEAAVLGVCAGAQMLGGRIADPEGVEGPPGEVEGLGRLPLSTRFAPTKVLDRPRGRVAAGPGSGHGVAGYRIHHGRIDGTDADPWLVTDDGEVVGWHDGRVLATTLHGLLEADDFRAALVSWVADRVGKKVEPATTSFADARRARFDRVADALEAHLDLETLAGIVSKGAP